MFSLMASCWRVCADWEDARWPPDSVAKALGLLTMVHDASPMACSLQFRVTELLVT